VTIAPPPTASLAPFTPPIALAASLCLAILTGCDRPGSGSHGGSVPADAAPAPITLAKRILDSGLVIEDRIEGAGDECPPGATVIVNFHASFEEGEEFDSSDRRGAPLTLPLDRPSTIEGLREGIPGMRIGGTRRLTIPWLLAYGEEGRDPIPPRMNLVFEIKLLRITSAGAAPARH